MNFNFITTEQEQNLHKQMEGIIEDTIGSDFYIFDGHNIHDDCEHDNFSQDTEIIENTISAILYRIFTEEALEIFTPEEIAKHVKEIIGIEMDQAYYCTRDWSAWSYGTMTGDDFEKIIDSENFTPATDSISNTIFTHIIQAEKELITKDLRPTENSSLPTKRL